MNETTGASVAVGPGLAALGWAVDTCTPTGIDSTGKWFYALAKNASRAAQNASTPWAILALELSDGSLRQFYELPASYPPFLAACEHAISADGACHAYVTAATRGGAGDRLVATRFAFISVEVVPILDVPTSSLPGSPLPSPVTSVTDYALWVSLSSALVGVDLATRLPSRLLPLPASGDTLSGGILFDVLTGSAFFLLTNASSGAAALASFVDAGAGAPLELRVSPAALGAVPARLNIAALADDQHAYIFVDAAGGLRTLRLADGAQGGSIEGWCSWADAGAAADDARGAAAKRACPLAIAYEPFVFDEPMAAR